MPTLAGTKLDKYDMLEEVGHGGMAVVYRGRDCVLKREVAVKVLHPHLADREESRRRLEREAIAVATLRHENILEIFDYSGPTASESYIVTEFIHGPTLRQWLDDDYTPRPAVAALVVHRLALALVHAHKGGIVHRDIKPENVMIRREDGCVKLMDFGIAQILDNQKLTMTGQLIGSPAYMAPELINGRPLDARTDLFSLGILLYQLATGELPFIGRNPHEVLNRIADGNYAPPSSVHRLCDPDLEAIIAKALANNPDERFQSAEALAAELEAYLEEMGIEPSTKELGAYFREPAAYLRDTDARVAAALMEHAQQATREGLHARAIKLLGRVLDLDGDNKAARAMLTRLRVRQRRMRQVLVGGATLGLVGLVGAGAMLMPEGTVEQEDRPPVLSVAVADDVPRPAGPLVGRAPSVVAPAPSTTIGRASAGLDDRPDADAGGEAPGVETRPGKPTVPRPGTPDRVAVKTECTLAFEGLPVNTAKNGIKVRIGSTYETTTSLSMPIAFDGAESQVRIVDEHWQAAITVRREACSRGPIPVPVTPKPARLEFADLPPKTVAVCTKGCPDGKYGQWLMADDYPAIPFDGDSTERTIRLTFKATGYEEHQQSFRLLPGRNEFRVPMKPRD